MFRIQIAEIDLLPLVEGVNRSGDSASDQYPADEQATFDGEESDDFLMYVPQRIISRPVAVYAAEKIELQ